MRLSCTVSEIYSLKDIGVTTLTFWGHVTSSVTWPLDSAYVVSNWRSIVTMRVSCTIMEIYLASTIFGSRPWPFGVTWRHRSCDHSTVTSSVTWPFDTPCGVSYRWSVVTRRLSGTFVEIFTLEYIAVTTLTFWVHMTSSVTGPFDSPYGVSYRWSMVTMRLSCTVSEIYNLKDIGVTTLTFWGHVTSSVTWPLDSA